MDLANCLTSSRWPPYPRGPASREGQETRGTPTCWVDAPQIIRRSPQILRRSQTPILLKYQEIPQIRRFWAFWAKILANRARARWGLPKRGEYPSVRSEGKSWVTEEVLIPALESESPFNADQAMSWSAWGTAMTSFSRKKYFAHTWACYVSLQWKHQSRKHYF